MLDLFFRVLLLILSLIALGFTGYWFYLALFNRPRFSNLMSENFRPRIPEQVQFISAIILFPLMIIGFIMMLMSLIAYMGRL